MKASMGTNPGGGGQKAAAAEIEKFRKQLGPFFVAVETTRMPMLFTDARRADNSIIFANNSFLALTGYEREEVVGCSFQSLMARGTDPSLVARLREVFAGNSESNWEGHSDTDPEIHWRRKNGTEFWGSIFISPVHNDSGELGMYFVSVVDHTRHRRQQLRCKTLIEELNHRVKNTLSTVQSIVWQVLKRSSDPGVIRESIQSRVLALSRSHDLLTHEKWEGVGLLNLMATTLEPFVTDGRSGRLSITGPNLLLPPKETLALGIALHELATNAVRHGAFRDDTGSITIEWEIKTTPTGPRLLLEWREKDGPAVGTPKHKGFGSHSIERGLKHELEAIVHLEYPADGVICRIDLPATHILRDV